MNLKFFSPHFSRKMRQSVFQFPASPTCQNLTPDITRNIQALTPTFPVSICMVWLIKSILILWHDLWKNKWQNANPAARTFPLLTHPESLGFCHKRENRGSPIPPSRPVHIFSLSPTKHENIQTNKKYSNNVRYMLTSFLDEPYSELESWVRGKRNSEAFDGEFSYSEYNEWRDLISNNWFPISSDTIAPSWFVWSLVSACCHGSGWRGRSPSRDKR